MDLDGPNFETCPLGTLEFLGACWRALVTTFIIMVFLFLVLLIVVCIIGSTHHKHPHMSIPHPTLCNTTLQVSKSGDGYRTISDAVIAAPDNSSFRTCIRIRSGVYKETVRIGYLKTNIVFLGDGIGDTILTSGPGFDRFTLRVQGYGFIAKDMTITSQGGQKDNESTVVDNWSDQSVFYGCRFIGYYNTLTLTTARQFYLDCQIVGVFPELLDRSHENTRQRRDCDDQTDGTQQRC